MASNGLRFPAALQVFPVLRSFRAIRPRRLAAVPIGNHGPIDNAHVGPCIRHLYHDLGVLAFAGCSNDQLRRMGDILQLAVESGGPGKMITMLDWVKKPEKRRIEPLVEEDMFESFDVAHGGIIRPGVILHIADTALRAHIHKLLRDAPQINPNKLQVRERNIHIRGTPSPKGIIHYTDRGSHRLPVDAFTTMSVDHRGKLTGELQLYSGGGKGEYVGGCRIDYIIYHMDRDEETMKPLYANKVLPVEGDDANRRNFARIMVKDYILRQLWTLESEVYGERADRVVRYQKVGLKAWGEQKRRGKPHDDGDEASVHNAPEKVPEPPKSSDFDVEFRDPKGTRGW